MGKEKTHWIWQPIIVIFFIILFLILFFYIIPQLIPKEPEQNQTGNGTLKTNLSFDEFNESDLKIFKSNNTGKLIISKSFFESSPLVIHCSFYQYFEGQEYLYGYVWIYPLCAMLETNSELELYNYNIKFKEYNICIYLMNNKSVGNCVM